MAICAMPVTDQEPSLLPLVNHGAMVGKDSTVIIHVGNVTISTTTTAH
jgi:hypothetical protein